MNMEEIGQEQVSCALAKCLGLASKSCEYGRDRAGKGFSCSCKVFDWVWPGSHVNMEETGQEWVSHAL